MKRRKKVKIECSLFPRNSLFVEDISISKKYFHYFFEKSQRPVRQLELTECDRPFKDLATTRRPSDLKWNLSGARDFPLFQDFPQNHIFSKLELINHGNIVLTEKQVKMSNHLILRKTELYEEYVIGNEERSIRDYYCSLSNPILEIYLKLNHVYSFILLCDHILLETFQIGTAFTAKFQKIPFRKEFVWDSLINGVKNAKKGFLRGKECVVLHMSDDVIVAVFSDFYGNDDVCEESFTAVKMERKLEEC